MDETTESIRVRVKVSWLEMEYEGAPSHIREHVIELVERLLSTRKESTQEGDGRVSIENELDSKRGSDEIAGLLDLSTSTIAAKMSVSTGSDLALAASAKLLLVDGRETFPRKDILGEMKKAPAYFKRTYSNNLTKSLEKLIKSDRLRLTAPEVYSISAKEQERLRTKLSQ